MILQVGAGTGLLVSGALVLVASECVVRSRGDGQLVCRLDCPARAATRGHHVQHACGADHYRRDYHGVLGGDRVSRAPDRP